MSELERLRGKLTDEQRKILTAIWHYFLEHKQWIPTRLLHQTCGGKPQVWASLEQLGGSIVVEYEEGSLNYYHLTFLGILLTEEGQNCEQLLIRYLAYVSEKCAAEPLRTHVSSQEIAEDLQLDPEQSVLLGFLIRESPFSGSGSFGIDGWNIEIPRNVEDFPQDLLTYIHERVMEQYDQAVPVAVAQRSSYLWTKRGEALRKETGPGLKGELSPNTYVDEARIAELQVIKSEQFDLARLIELCRELNICYSNGCYLAVAMLTRALIDHVPPIFGAKTFSEITNSNSGSRSFRDSMQHLGNSCRRIADAHLHVQIRGKEVLPNKTQVNFSNDLDVLLGEIVRLLR
jgi:hypothetical protein